MKKKKEIKNSALSWENKSGNWKQKLERKQGMCSTENLGGVIMQEKCSKSSKVKCRTLTQRHKKQMNNSWEKKSSSSISAVHWSGIVWKRQNTLYLLCVFFVSCAFKKQQCRGKSCPAHGLMRRMLYSASSLQIIFSFNYVDFHSRILKEID